MVVNKGQVKEIKLAYPIKKQTIAHFGFLQFKAVPDAVRGIVESLALNTSVLRTLVVSSPAKLEQKRGELKFPRTRAPKEEVSVPVAVPFEKRGGGGGMLSNEALEERLEEILK